MEKINVGVIGVGGAGRTHLECLARYNKNTKLVAVTGGPKPFYKRAEELAKKYKIDCEESVKSLIEREDIHAVMVDTPNQTHADITILAAENGKHAFVELPLATTLEESDAMIKACEKAGVNLMVGQHQRFRKGHALAKKAIDEGKIGRVFMVRDTMLGDNMGWMPDWLKHPKDPTNLGILVGPGTHAIDRVNWLINGWNMVESVFASCGTFRENTPIEGTSMVLVRYKHGITASFWTSFEATPPVFPHSNFICQLMGTHGNLDIDPYDKLRIGIGDKWKTIFTQPKVITDTGSDAYLAAVRLEAYADTVQDFIDSIIQERKPSIPGEQDRYNIEIALAAYKSSKTGQAIKLPLK